DEILKQDWIGSKYSCYWIRKEHMKWKEALHFCESAATGAHLLDINTEEEHMLISSKGLCELELEMNTVVVSGLVIPQMVESYLPIIPLPQNTKSTIFPVQHHTIS
uniref:C-type lectin domain-containing protein n=1 Tax=Callorhinchus milii TaxID=7868 RepID=A0A4W3I7U8_CALMI